jgi:hypothetical protein
MLGMKLPYGDSIVLNPATITVDVGSGLIRIWITVIHEARSCNASDTHEYASTHTQ